MATPGGGFGFAGHKRSAEEAMLDSLAPMGALQAEVLAAAAGMDTGEHKHEDDALEQENLALVLQAAENHQAPRGASGKAPTKSAGPLVAPLDTLIPVPEVDRRVFDSWEDFHSYLLDYGRRTHQLYSVRSATPASRRNHLLAKKRPARTNQLIPDSFHHYVKTITCTHGGKPRHRSTGARPNHHHRAIQCPAQINACVKRDAQGWRVHVTNQHAWHNHEVSEALYKSYPEVRNALDPDVLATVNILRKAEAKRRKIFEYIVEHSPQQPRMKDVHNLLSKLKREEEKQKQ